MVKKLSIITVNYNDKNGLQKTIESVVNQTWKDFEFIVIDGGSKDGSAELLIQYQNRIAYGISETDSGVYNAMNKGIRKATGDYVLFLNSGDILNDPKVLEKVEQNLDCTFGIYYGDANYIEKDGEHKRTYPDQLSFSFFLDYNLSHQASFIKRNLFFDIFLYNEDYKIVSDWAFFIYAICNQNVPYKHLNLIICKYDTMGISSIIDNHKAMHEERRATIQKYFPLFIEDYNSISEIKSKRFKQFAFIKSHPIAFKILKGFMNLILAFLPKFKK
ncbi:glycosyltransferase family 2 protein [Pedobacter fastidiosus]|uniref:Glycosyltransferase n=1 Tax=Pedobacter fastidiosus TaxID=2765361 RepID=A0ABR7KSD8_9SPHI|nr:glycosyltransferase family 2 protein [Pedobacter fastidiosus]MBC6111026.1 glycosyltransferase [Pedobacter fastidiosus]